MQTIAVGSGPVHVCARIHEMPDHDLRKFRRAATWISDPTKNFGTPNPAFKIQLDEARAEWRRSTLTIHRRKPPP